MSDKEKDPEILGALLEDKYEQIEMLLDVIRDIYSIRGEDKEISDRCNRVLCDTRFISTI